MTLKQYPRLHRTLFVAMAALCFLWPLVGSATALLLGLSFSLLLGNPFAGQTKNLTQKLLSASIVGLGAGMNLATVASVGLHGIASTAVGILLAIGTGLLLGRWLGISRDTSWLLSIGTAICGGSAIAAAAPVLRAKSEDVSIALGIVFILNSLALVLFPWIGHALDLTQAQFGLWSALAIHDTSSVVGATLSYGTEAAHIGTTVKLARALWIIPLTLALAWIVARRDPRGEAAPRKYPWFILGFLIAAALFTYIPTLQPLAAPIETLARRLLVLTIFILGAGISRATLQQMGLKPLILGVALWLLLASVSLFFIAQGWLSLPAGI